MGLGFPTWCIYSLFNTLNFLETTLLTLTECVMLLSITSFIADMRSSLRFMWLKQTTVKDVSTLNRAFILHPTCLLWGSAPSFHQRYLISIISIVSESDCLFNTSLKLMPCFRQSCCLSLNTEISKRMTHCSPGKLDNATQLT